MDNVRQLEMDKVSKSDKYKSIIESILFMSGDAISIKEIGSIIKCSEEKTNTIIKEMEQDYKNINRGIKIIIHNNKVQLVTKQENSEYIEKLLNVNVRQSLSQAALETLSIIAYKQPVTRVAIDEIRGVKSDRALATLMEKGIIKECGRLEVPGKPILYGTTEEFLKYFGLDSIDSMPRLEDILKNFEEK
ncbi:segregation/condensation protein B [Clostridium niameyense]|uniref:Segregation and condensation protein B n=1 Tax=Clostridium niameyense TaxID=1622073 RepID=A0A6M0R7S8_9CLOT|nr:SMC-Scp complex subunit ScpB [Clostridium niameyense]NEZ46273.1 segregation/condensation protein B [Clostridium niameyense]